MKPGIQIHEPYRKTWSEPEIIVSRDDIVEYEKSLASNRSQKHGTEELADCSPKKTDSEIFRESQLSQLAERLQELRNSHLQSELVKRQLSTPKKCDNMESRATLQSNVSGTPSQESDWMIPELARSRSLPSSPVLGSSSPVQSPTRLHSVTQRCFSFVPERLRQLEQTRLLPESDEVDNGSRLPQRCCKSPHGSNGFPAEGYLDTIGSAQERYLLSPTSIRSRQQTENQLNIQPIRAKRKLDMDESYSISAKRTKSEVAREAGMRYVSQLELDLMALKHRLHYASPEMVSKPSNCACAEMEKHFMEMAMSAYKSIRRYDGSMNSFERFKQELTQTNQVIKDSMELLQNVRRLCIH